LLFIRALVSVAGPILGMWSDRYGRRNIMAIGLLLQAISVVGLAISWQWWATIPTILSGLSVAAFVPAQQAYISDETPYQKRGRALATVEFGWSMSAIVTLPIIGWMIDMFGWRSPFLALSLLSLVGAIIVWWQLPPAAERHAQTSLSWRETKAIFLRGNVMASVSVALLVFVAASAYLTVWGIWLTADFQFDAVALGLVATTIGIAELVGAGLSGLFIDRIGKKRGSELALLLLIVTFILLPLTQGRVSIAITALVVMGIVFEFTIVSLIPLYSEQVPEARGTVLSLIFLGIGIGGAMGAPIATTLWEKYGLWAVSAVAVACLLAAFGLAWKFLNETHVSQ
jgi:DHA1 family inner membrane transport protein